MGSSQVYFNVFGNITHHSSCNIFGITNSYSPGKVLVLLEDNNQHIMSADANTTHVPVII